MVHPSVSLHMKDSWVEPGRHSSGVHLCLVTQLLGGDLKGFAEAHDYPSRRFPMAEANHVLLDFLRSISVLHSNNVIHSDIKINNLFYELHLPEEAMLQWLSADPPHRNSPEISVNGNARSAVSQPHPVASPEEFIRQLFLLGNTGSIRERIEYRPVTICPVALRPPEIYLEGHWSEKADIWMFGFVRAFGWHPLFDYSKDGSSIAGQKLDAVESMLHQMTTKCHDQFDEPQLRYCHKGEQYFNRNCKFLGMLRSCPDITVFLDGSLAHWHPGIFSKEQWMGIMAFVSRYLRLDPQQRPSALELLQDEFWGNASVSASEAS
ncbi:kinase-like domain-containing protein [Pterulicium gracile]|uniref:Kinase-like domain-containing protein n=1 Tax=Pterulicium gracile TaxID=1884261 RepID=A0A5C3QSU2_9AGAR|nr:kinase-like domain-containing protein [Pterula gracilis]